MDENEKLNEPKPEEVEVTEEEKKVSPIGFEFLIIQKTVLNIERLLSKLVTWVIICACLSLISFFIGLVNYDCMNEKNVTQNQVIENKVLDGFKREDANKFMDALQKCFNDSNSAGMYDLIGDNIKPLIEKGYFDGEVEKAFHLFGGIKSYTYSGMEYLGDENGFDLYALRFISSFESGNGIATITVAVIDDEVEMVGFNFNIN